MLSRLIGFEIMMTSYVVAHLKIRRTIDETLGHLPTVQLPTNIFLTNTLAPPISELERGEQLTLFDLSAAITDEAYHADTWKVMSSYQSNYRQSAISGCLYESIWISLLTKQKRMALQISGSVSIG